MSTCLLVLQKYNRRMKQVQEEEQDMWKFLKPTDMSEESDDESTLVVHKPNYRSAGMCKISTVLFHCSIYSNTQLATK